jgi:uncharacterized protein
MCKCAPSRLVWRPVSNQSAQRWRQRLRDELLSARKSRDTVRVSAVRSALSAIDNAETPDGARVDAKSSGTIAGGVVGLGAAEVARRELSDAQIRELVHAEIDERLTATRDFTAGDHPERAATLRGRGGRAQRRSRRCLTAVPGWARAAH